MTDPQHVGAGTRIAGGHHHDTPAKSEDSMKLGNEDYYHGPGRDGIPSASMNASLTQPIMDSETMSLRHANTKSMSESFIVSGTLYFIYTQNILATHSRQTSQLLFQLQILQPKKKIIYNSLSATEVAALLKHSVSQAVQSITAISYSRISGFVFARPSAEVLCAGHGYPQTPTQTHIHTLIHTHAHVHTCLHTQKHARKNTQT